jgi:hypothetical protein
MTIVSDNQAVAPINRDVLDILQERLPFLVSQLTRRANVDSVTADSGSAESISVNRITLGSATVENVTLSGINAALIGSQALMQGVRMVLELRFSLEWEVDLGWLGSWGDTVDLGSLSFPVDVGNVSVPSLANIQFSVPTATTTNVSANIDPVQNLTLGATQINKLAATDTDAPSSGFSLNGLGLGAVSMSKLSLPQTATAKVTVDEVKPSGPITLPGLSLTGVNLPAVQVGTINSGGFGIAAHISRRSLIADLGILEFKLNIDPVTHLNVQSMTIHDASFAATVNRVEVKNIKVPVTIQGVELRKLGLNAVKVNQITL